MSNEPDELKTLATIVLGAVMNGLTSLLAASDQEVAKQVVGRDILENLQLEPTALPPSRARFKRDNPPRYAGPSAMPRT